MTVECPFTYEQMKEAGWSDEQLLATPEYAHLIPSVSIANKLVEYDRLSQTIDDLSRVKEAIREELAHYMHTIKARETIIADSNGKEWSLAYQVRNNKKVDHDKLLDAVGRVGYNEIVTMTNSESLFIRPNKKPKRDVESVINISPVSEQKQSKKPSVPIGALS